MIISDRALTGPSVQEVEDIVAQSRDQSPNQLIQRRFIESLRWAILGSANSFHVY